MRSISASTDVTGDFDAHGFARRVDVDDIEFHAKFSLNMKEGRCYADARNPTGLPVNEGKPASACECPLDNVVNVRAGASTMDRSASRCGSPASRLQTKWCGRRDSNPHGC